MVKYSIIIPHKDVPELLSRCLASIPCREDLEVIVIDDNSNPDIVDFSHFPGLGQNNVRVVFTKEGKGAGYARNVGIEHARGQWLLFADADDYYITGNLNTLLDLSLPRDCEVVMWRYVTLGFNGESSIDSQKVAGEPFELVECFDEMYPYLYCAAYNKMVKADFIKRKKCYFEEIPAANDIMFSAIISASIDKYYFFNADCYYYVRRRNSVMNTDSVANITSRHEAAIRVNEYLLRKGKPAKFDGGYGNMLAQAAYPVYFAVFCKDIRTSGFRNAYKRYKSCCRDYAKISLVPFYTYLKRKAKKFLKLI